MRTGLCGVCPAGCAVRATFEDGRLRRLRPLGGHPMGFVCPRGAHAAEIVYSPERLLHPKRRRAGRWVRSDWDTAYADIARRLRDIARRDGPEAIAIYSGRGNFEFALNEFFAPAGTSESSANAVLFPFGSPNATGVGALCYAAHAMIAPRACFGAEARELRTDLEGADLVLVWGANPATDSPPRDLLRLRRARARGARIVVIDHRRSETARTLGCEWLGVRPGTDGALALGLAQVILARGLHDRAFCERWTHGFEDFAAYAAGFTPARVAGITGVSEARIVELALALAGTPATAVLMYTGLEYADSGVQAVRAVWSLQALTGHLDAPGANQFVERERPRTRRLLTAPPRGRREAIGAREFPLYHAVRKEAHAGALPQAILEGEPYPVRALIVSGASILTAWPDPARWRRALAALDLLVVVNRFPTADARYADWMLPAATPFETESFITYPDGRLQWRERMIEPLGEARSDYLIFAELAAHLGYGERWPQTEQAMIEYALQGTGVGIEALRAAPAGIALPAPARRYRKYRDGGLRADGRPGFETASGRFEFTSEWVRAAGHEPLPVYTEPREGPRGAAGLAQRFPLVLDTGARTQYAFRSQHFNIPGLVAKQPEPLVHLHPRDASARGLEDGDPVWVISPRGRAPFRLRVSGDIVPGAAEANMGGGGALGPPAWRRCNVNVLTDPAHVDPISGFPVFKALLCEVRARRARKARAGSPRH